MQQVLRGDLTALERVASQIAQVITFVPISKRIKKMKRIEDNIQESLYLENNLLKRSLTRDLRLHFFS